MNFYAVGKPDGTVNTRESRSLYTHAVISQRKGDGSFVVTYHKSEDGAAREVSLRLRQNPDYERTHVRPVVAVVKMTDRESWTIYQHDRILEQGFFKRTEAVAKALEFAKVPSAAGRPTW